MHKAIIFDLGGVLVQFDFRRAYRALARRALTPKAEISERIAATGLVERFETGLVEPRDFFAQLSRTLELRPGLRRFLPRSGTTSSPTPCFPRACSQGLAARYRLLLLSNTNAIHFEMIRQAYPLLRHFHEMMLSYEVGP